MLNVSGLCKAYGDQQLFDNGSFVLAPRERLGLVGRNGSGKSTLFKLILGEEHHDSGSITYPKGYRIGRLSQHLSFSRPSVLEEVCMGLPADERDQTYRGEIILSGLGFAEDDMQRSPSELSGGFQIRIDLARLLLSEPNLLLLDEPTNYLDIVSIRWLAGVIRSWKNELIIITHDRAFMDSVTTHTMIINRGGFRKIAGSTEKLYEAIAIDEEVYEKTRQNDEKKRRDMEAFINRFRAKASKASVVQSRVKALEKIQVREELTEEESLEFSFASRPFHGRVLMDAKNLSFGYGDSPDLITDLTVSVGKNDRIGIIGKNGRGKSTLLRLMAGELPPREGTVTTSANAVVSYFGQTNINRLSPALTVEEEITQAHPGMHRTRIRGICGTMMFDGDKALKKVSVLSGGERSRVLLGKIIATPSNMLLLDEPTNHLDLYSVEALKDALADYDGALVLVTHDEMLLRELCTRLVIFQGAAPFLLEGGYEYFLDKIGWEEEANEQPQRKDKGPSSRAKPQGNKRAQQAQRDIEKLENKIVSLEEEERSLQKLLSAATNRGESAQILEISVRLHEIAGAIEKAFEKLSERSKEALPG